MSYAPTGNGEGFRVTENREWVFVHVREGHETHMLSFVIHKLFMVFVRDLKQVMSMRQIGNLLQFLRGKNISGG